MESYTLVDVGSGKQVMVCLLGAKPLPEPVPSYCQLDPQEEISLKFKSFIIQENAFKKCQLQNDSKLVLATTC